MLFLQIIIFSLPLYLARFSVFGLKTNVLDILLGIFILWQFINSRHGVRLPRSFQSLAMTIREYLIPFFLILIGAIIATARSSDIFRSLGILKSYFIFPVLFFFAASSVIKTQEQKEKILRSWFLSGFIVALISFFYWLTGELTYDNRLRAFFESPNQLAMFLAPAFIVGIYITTLSRGVIPASYSIIPAEAGIHVNCHCEELRGTKQSNLWIPVYIGMIAIIGAVIFATNSLGTIMALFIALLPFFYRHIKSKKNRFLILVLFLLLVVSCLSLVIDKDFSERSSLSSRKIIWQSTGAILKDNWLLGIGPGTFQEKYLEYQKYFPPYLEWASPQPHNIFLAFWLQTGIVGFAGFLWLIFIFFKNIWINKNDNVVFLSGVLMIYTLMHGLFDATYWKNDLAVIFWLIILLSLSLSQATSPKQQD